jgi:PAS domain S-box-containing protein
MKHPRAGKAMDKNLRLLLVEDNEDDALILNLHLEREGYNLKCCRIETLEDMERQLVSEKWDLLISDYNLQGFNGRDAFEQFRKQNIDIPFILVSGAVGEETAAELMRLGVHDFILKGKLQRLVPAIERERAEMVTRRENKAYLEQLSKAKIIIDSSSVVLWEAELEPEVNIYFCSDNISQYGYSPGDFSSYNEMFKALTHPDDLKFLPEIFLGHIREKTARFSLESRYVCKDGSIRWINSLFRHIDNPDRGKNLLQCINIDITERKGFEHELIAARDKAEESDRFKSMLIANLNHELHTPLNGILGFAQVLKQTLQADDEVEMSDSILTSAQRLQLTLDSVMIMARLESGIELNESNLHLVNLSAELEKIGSLYRKKYSLKEIQFSAQIEPDVMVKANNKLLNTALGNVIDNAFKFTDKGAVSIILKADKNADKPFAELVVSDTGIGIDPANLELVFHPYRQESEGYTRSHDGLGLGLPIASKILELMKGSISVSSIRGNGSDFTIRLPLLLENEIG